MSRNSWWSFSYVEQSFAEQSEPKNHNNHSENNNKLKDSQKDNGNIPPPSSSSPSSPSSTKEQRRSENIISETASDISDTSSTTTLVEPLTNNSDHHQTSNAIPIPKSRNGRVRNYDEQKNKSYSSLKSWWSSSNTPSYNQKDTTIHNNHHHSTEEKQKSLTGPNTSTNSTSNNIDKSKSVRNDKQLLRHDNGSSISILTPINENGPYEKERSQHHHEAVEMTRSNSRENDQKKQKSNSNKSNLDSDTESVDKPSNLVRKTSDAKLSSSYSSMSSTTSSRGWWMFGGNPSASREDVSSNNMTKPETITNANPTSEPIQVDTTMKQTDQISKAGSTTINHLSSSSSDDDEISTSNESQRKVRKKSSSEIRRWSLFGTWSSSTSNLLEGENGKSVGETNTSKSDTHLPSSTSSSTEPASPSNNDNTNPSNRNNHKNSSPDSHKHKRSTNPIVQTLSDNRSSWLHFFTNSPQVQPNRARIDKVPNMTMIKDDSEPEVVTKASKNSLKVSTTIDEVEKKVVVDTSNISISQKLKPVPANVILPSFDEFTRNKPRKSPNSVVQQTLHAINSYFFPPDKLPESTLPKWLDELTRSTVDVKRIAIIGVHGWYPTRTLRAVFGEPTGTSPKFCDMMAKAVLGYLSQHGNSLPSDAITCIPLEGEGTISTREQLLHKNLLHNKTWCEALSLADVVFVATHSQGTPVSTILLSRLIKEGLVHPKRQRICMLAMAGISHGPFPYLKETYIVKYFLGAGRSHDADAARELFEFMDSESLVSKKYREALNVIIQNRVKLVYVASMDDQVVPLYSGVFTGVDHPSIMRAIYIDGPLYQADDFLTNLIVFAIKLRNAGILDHGLIVQLSEIVAGSMYGTGHSALYNEVDVYMLAIRYLFETPSFGFHDLGTECFQAQLKYNPFYLPWAMRGILEDRIVSRHYPDEIRKLRKQYEDWDPASKTMKDIKFRLEPLKDAILLLGRSKL